MKIQIKLLRIITIHVDVKVEFDMPYAIEMFFDRKSEECSLALELILGDFKPIYARIEEIGLVEFRPVKHHGSYKLLKGDYQNV